MRLQVRGKKDTDMNDILRSIYGFLSLIAILSIVIGYFNMLRRKFVLSYSYKKWPNCKLYKKTKKEIFKRQKKLIDLARHHEKIIEARMNYLSVTGEKYVN